MEGSDQYDTHTHKNGMQDDDKKMLQDLFIWPLSCVVLICEFSTSSRQNKANWRSYIHESAERISNFEFKHSSSQATQKKRQWVMPSHTSSPLSS